MVFLIQHVRDHDGQKPKVFSERNPTAFAPNFKTPAPSTGSAFSAIFPRVFASLLVALTPFFTAFLAPTTMVVMIPVTEIATTEMPPKLLLAHLLNLSNLVRLLFSTSFSTMLRASLPLGCTLARRCNSSAFNTATSAMELYRSFFFGSDCLSASSLQ